MNAKEIKGIIHSYEGREIDPKIRPWLTLGREYIHQERMIGERIAEMNTHKRDIKHLEHEVKHAKAHSQELAKAMNQLITPSDIEGDD